MASNIPEYTDLQRTRVVRRLDSDGASGPGSIGSTQPLKAEKKGLFDDLSIAQIIAGAGAAATSVLLASHIGVYGSVIGAAVSSVVTVIATQVYRRALTAGAKKINDGLGVGGSAQETSRIENPYRADLNAPAGTRSVRGARTAPASYRARAAEERHAVQRKVIIASVVVAVIAVALSAGAILLTTAGQGLGDRPTVSTTGTTDESTSERGTAGTAQSDSNTNASTDTSSTDSSDATGGSSSSSTSTSGTGSTDQSSSDSSSSGTSDSSNTGSSDTGTSGSSDSSTGDTSSTSNSSSQSGASSTSGTSTSAAAVIGQTS